MVIFIFKDLPKNVCRIVKIVCSEYGSSLYLSYRKVLDKQLLSTLINDQTFMVHNYNSYSSLQDKNHSALKQCSKKMVNQTYIFFAAFYRFSGYKAIRKRKQYSTILASISMLLNPNVDSRFRRDYYLFQFALFTTRCESVSNESIACLLAGSLC